MACGTQKMGLGDLGAAGAGLDLRFKRKFRWTFRVDNICRDEGATSVPENFVKLASRPNLTIDEVEINYLNGKTWIPGKATWETITVTYYDVAHQDNAGLWRWLASVYDFTDPTCLRMGATRKAYSGTAILALWDGCGEKLEEWTLDDCWPQAINFGDLDYAASEEVVIELTLRYSQVKYEAFCGVSLEPPCCDPC